MNSLPAVQALSLDWCGDGRRRLFIAAEGFEHRSEAFLARLPKKEIFDRVLLVRYAPARRSRTEPLLEALIPRLRGATAWIEFDRFKPALFEPSILEELRSQAESIDEIVLDISVMSKLLIMLFINSIAQIPVNLRLIYSEPADYAPTQEAYERAKPDLISSTTLVLPTSGVHEVVRTPGLSSTVMQRSPTLLIAFTSFNEQLIRALLTWINPSRLFLINSVPPRLKWRASACQEIHASVIEEFKRDNRIGADGGLLLRASTLEYAETLSTLARLYREHCRFYRLIVSPTGSKMQGVGCALFRLCCPDVHIEYPTPESHLLSGYSSEEIRMVHMINFGRLSETLAQMCTELRLVETLLTKSTT